MMRRAMVLTLPLMAALLAPTWSDAEGSKRLPHTTLDMMRQVAIQHNGRVKPFDSYARETLQLITGTPRIGHDDAVDTVLSIMTDAEYWQAQPLLSIPFIPLREALGLDRKTARVSYNQLIETRKLMRMLPAIVQKQQRDEKLSMLENETMDAFQRFTALSGLFEHRLNLVPAPPGSTDPVWRAILKPAGYTPQQQQALRNAWSTFVMAAPTGGASAIDAAALQLTTLVQQANPAVYPARWRLVLEVFYNASAPFHIARWLYFIGCLWLLVSVSTEAIWASALGFVAVIMGYLVHLAGILARVVLGGRPPVSNFFETMLWLPFVAVTVALIFERIYRVGYFGLAASMLSIIVLVLADYVPLDSSISPVVAVLHSNLWLTIHVLTIVASYGALALATVLAHIYGVLYLRRRSHAALSGLSTFLYRSIQVGVVLLAGGVMLGAVWANASWGRYWGWDPKETWALITLLWFLAILHGRFAGWIHGVGVALATIGGFFLLLMTYYGVSFYLVGLHSYAGGHAKPLPTLLIGYVIAELIFLVIVGLSALTHRPLVER